MDRNQGNKDDINPSAPGSEYNQRLIGNETAGETASGKDQANVLLARS